MSMWLRLVGALLITALVISALDYFGVSSAFTGRTAEDIQHDWESRMSELFWLAIFVFVMIMSVVTAARRWGGQLRGATADVRLRRRNMQ
jgi:heme/copper-type cytochrome/quinol oxidase subunit 2